MPPKRAKELLTEALCLSPIRLLGGFICIDTHLGCLGCSYCLNRRDPLLHRILNEGHHCDYRSIGYPPKRLAALIRESASFAARVPIRIGHLTDWHYEVDDSIELLAHLPADYPVVCMTRFPLSSKQVEWLNGRRNTIVHVSLAPAITAASADRQNHQRIIESFAAIDPAKLFLMMRPLRKGAETEARLLIEQLPADAYFNCWKLSTNSIPSMTTEQPMRPEQIDQLIAAGRGRGLRYRRFFGCLLRATAKAPFPKATEALRLDSGCADCDNRERCQSERPVAPEAVAALLKKLSIQATTISITEEIYIETENTTARAEEVYLAEQLGREVRFSTIHRGTTPTVVSLEHALFERWQGSGFFPVAELDVCSEAMRQAI